MNIDGIILAAGLSSRMGTNKLLLPFQGRPILQHVIDLAAALPLCSRVLVTREQTLAAVSVPSGFSVVINPEPGRGQSSSMRLGLERAEGEGYLFFQGDQPLLDAGTVNSVIALADSDSIVVPVYEGTPGNPAFFAARFRDELMAVSGDRGGRSVRDRHFNLCRQVKVTSPWPMWDVDTREKYDAMLAWACPAAERFFPRG